MSWYDDTPLGFVANGLGVGSADPSNYDRSQLDQTGAGASGFAGQTQAGYNQNQAGINNTEGMLQGIASGQNSVSAEQLRQGLAQSQAQQMSAAASASPNNQAAASRNAMMNMGQQASGMMGQQAMAGLQERQNALNTLSQTQLGQSGQNMQGTLGGYGAANNAYGTAVGNPQKTWGTMTQGAIGGFAAGLAKSDKRAKTAIQSADDEASEVTKGLKAYTFRYKNSKDGKGKQLGVMAQDLESAGLKHAVIDTPDGKMVHGAKLATANTAMIAALGRRLSKLEGKGK